MVESAFLTTSSINLQLYIYAENCSNGKIFPRLSSFQFYNLLGLYESR